MARLLQKHGPVPPRDRLVDFGDEPRAIFFPNEVAHALAIRTIDYAQLRSFYRIIRDPDGTRGLPPGWSRYTLTDMAALVVALDLCGGRQALGPGRHLVVDRLRRACRMLYGQGFPQPLLNVKMVREGRAILVDLDGMLLDPLSGQLRIAVVASHADDFFDGSLLKDPEMAAAIKKEIAAHRGRRT